MKTTYLLSFIGVLFFFTGCEKEKPSFLKSKFSCWVNDDSLEWSLEKIYTFRGIQSEGYYSAIYALSGEKRVILNIDYQSSAPYSFSDDTVVVNQQNYLSNRWLMQFDDMSVPSLEASYTNWGNLDCKYFNGSYPEVTAIPSFEVEVNNGQYLFGKFEGTLYNSLCANNQICDSVEIKDGVFYIFWSDFY